MAEAWKPFSRDELSRIDPNAIGQLPSAPPVDPQAAIYAARNLNPDEEAAAQRLAAKAGTTVEAAKSQKSGIEADLAAGQIDYQHLAKNSPALSKWLSEQPNANKAHDDTHELSLLEKAIRAEKEQLKDFAPLVSLGRSAAAAVVGDVPAGTAGIMQTLSSALSADIGQPLSNMIGMGDPFARMTELFSSDVSFYRNVGDVVAGERPQSYAEQIVVDAARSFGLQAPGFVAMLATKNPSYMLAGAGAMTAGQAGSEALDAGVDPNLAVAHAGVQGGAEVLGEMIPALRLLEDMKVGNGFFKTLLHNQMSEQVGEQATQAMQDLGDWAVLHPDKTLKDFIAERPEVMTRVALVTLAQGVMTVGAAHIGTGIRQAVDQKVSADRAARSQEYLSSVTKLAAATKMAGRDPDGLSQLITQMAEEGGAPKTVYIDSADLGEVLKQSNMTIADLGDMMPDKASDIMDSFMTGGVVELPVGDVIAKIANTPMGEAMLPHVRLEEDGFSTTQADKFLADYETNQTAKADAILAKHAETSDFRQSAMQIRNQVESELTDIGMSPAAAKENARLTEAFFTTAAKDWGGDMTPGKLFERFYGGKNVVRGEIGQQAAGESLTQDVTSPEFSAWFGDSKVVDDAGKPLVVHHSSTYGDFSVFDKSEQRKGMAGFGFYFTDTEGSNIYAAHSSKFKMDRDWRGNEKKINTIPVYLQMQNPLVADNIASIQAIYGKRDPGAFGVGREIAGISVDAKTAIERDGYDGVIASEYVTRQKDGSLKVVDPATKGAIKHPVYVVFNPEQIKSVFNRGTYNPNDPNILNQAVHPYSKKQLDSMLAEGVLTKGEHERMVKALTEGKGNEQGIQTAGRNGQPDDGGRTVAGLPATPGWREATVAVFRRNGAREPARLWRGSSDGLTRPEDFSRESLGKASGHPSAHLGVWLTSQRGDASKYGKPSDYHADIRNPKVMETNEVPVFEDAAAAQKFRDDLIAQGHDGIIFDYRDSDPNAPVHFVVFEPGQVILPSRVLNQSAGERSSAQIIAEGVVKDLRGKTADAIEYINGQIAFFEKQAATPRPAWMSESVVERNIADYTEALRLIESGEVSYQKQDASRTTPEDWEPDAELISAAKKVFGATSDPKEAGYVLPDGTMLDFSGRHYADRKDWPYLRGQRSVDHRELQSENTNNGKSLEKQMEFSGSEGMYEFMARTGAMRMDAASGVASISRPPTDKQISVIGNARKGDYLALSYNRPDGEIVVDGEFESANPMKVRKFFEEAQKQEGGTGILAQQARGTYRPADALITMNKAHNLSTFIHEGSHSFLDLTMKMAVMPDAPQAVKDRANAVLDWFGIKGDPEVSAVETWLAMDLEDQRQYHEQFAESFEEYTFHGKAPSLELAAAFARFRDWMVAIYKTLKQMRATNKLAALDQEISSVFDRMLATDEQIAEAATARAVIPLFTSKPASMSVEQWADYQKQLSSQDAHDHHVIDRKKLMDMQWLREKGGRILKELQRDAKRKRIAMREKASRLILNEPAYKARQLLRSRAGAEESSDNIYAGSRLDRAEIVRRFGEDVAKKLGRMAVNEGGAPADMIASITGFKSADDLVKTLAETKKIDDAIEELTDTMMLQTYGDITSPEALQRAVDEALMSGARSKIIATEIGLVSGILGKVSQMVKAAKLAASSLISDQKIGAIRPDKYRLAATRAAREAEKALAAGDTNTVVINKRTQLLNTELFNEASKARDFVAKKTADFRKMFKGDNEEIAKRRDMQLVNVVRAILAERGIGPNVAGQDAQTYLNLVAQYDLMAFGDIQSIMANLPDPKPVKEMTMSEFRALADAVDGIWKISRLMKTIKINGELIEQEAVAGELTADALTHLNGTLPIPDSLKKTATTFDKFIRGARGTLAQLIRVEAWCGHMGPAFTKYIFRPVSKAIANHRVYRTDKLRKYRDALKAVEPHLTFDPIQSDELGFTFNGGMLEVIHVLLHTGNESNKRKLLMGRTDPDTLQGWAVVNPDGSVSSEKLDAFIDRLVKEGKLKKEHFDFAQSVWDLMDEMKADSQKAHHEMYGYYFNEITAKPIVTPFGTYRGGYVPAVADKNDPNVAPKVEAEELLHSNNSFMFPSTGRGFTKGRVEFNKPLELDLRSIGMHIDKVSRFVNIEPTMRSVARLCLRDDVRKHANAVTTDAMNNMINPWLQRCARQTVSNPGGDTGLNKLLRGLQKNAGLSMMAANVANALQQFTGLSVAAIKVPIPFMMRALRNYTQHPLQMQLDISSKSKWMADRISGQSFDMQHQIEKIMVGPGLVGSAMKTRAFIQNNAYFLQAAFQNQVDCVTWLGAYDHALSKGMSPEDAIAHADESVRLTQGSFAPEDIANFEASAPGYKIFFQFAGYFNMLANLMGTEGAAAMREMGFGRKSSRLAYIWFMGLCIPAVISQAIAQGLPGDDDDEDGDGLLDEYMAMFFKSQIGVVASMAPLVGNVTMTIVNQFDEVAYNDKLNTSPTLSYVAQAIQGIAASKDVAEAAVAEDMRVVDEVSKRKVKDSLALIALVTGIPTGQLAKTLGYALDVEQGNATPKTTAEAVAGMVRGR